MRSSNNDDLRKIFFISHLNNNKPFNTFPCINLFRALKQTIFAILYCNFNSNFQIIVDAFEEKFAFSYGNSSSSVRIMLRSCVRRHRVPKRLIGLNFNPSTFCRAELLQMELTECHSSNL